jgi:hypothetical protein
MGTKNLFLSLLTNVENSFLTHVNLFRSLGLFFFSETTHVRKPGLQTFRKLNSREFIPEFNGNNILFCPCYPNVGKFLF